MYWMIAALVAVFGVVLLARVGVIRPPDGTRRRGTGRGSEPLKPGEHYDTSVKLATVPNAPMADLWCQRLREEGIEAFYKTSLFSAPMYGGTTNPSLPAEVWVGEHNAERARELFPELG